MENLAHPAAVHRRHRGYKFVTNWCFSSKGTEKLARHVRGWTEHAPRHGIISDDISAMYQWTSRWAGFAFLRKRFPSLLAIFRFFYYSVAATRQRAATVRHGTREGPSHVWSEERRIEEVGRERGVAWRVA